MDSEARSDSRLFGELLRSLLKEGVAVRFRAAGRSMHPAIRDGEVVQVEPASSALERGHVVMAQTSEGFRVHRVVRSGSSVHMRGDCSHDREIAGQVLGTVALVDGEKVRAVPRQRLGSVIRRWVSRLRGHF